MPHLEIERNKIIIELKANLKKMRDPLKVLPQRSIIYFIPVEKVFFMKKMDNLN